MRLAAIDIGTNSLHMIVVRVRPDLSFEVIDREKEMVRLGSGGGDMKLLAPEAIERAGSAGGRLRLFDAKGQPVLLFESEWAMRWAGDHEKDLTFHQIAP